MLAGSRIAQLTKIPFGANEPLLHRALEAGGVGLWDYLPSTGLIDLYHNVLSFKTLRPGRYYGPVAEFAQYILVDDRAAVDRMLAQCMDNVNEVYVEFRIRTQSGHIAWLACRGQLAKLDDGRARYVGAISDITDASERELKLLAYHESLFSLARNPLVVDRADFASSAVQIIQHSAVTLRCTRGGLWKFTDDGQALQCLYQYDARLLDNPSGADAAAPKAIGAIGPVLQAAAFPTYFSAISQRRSLAVEDALTDPLLHEFRATYLPATGVLALLDVPVFHHGLLWGIVCFEDCSGTRTWDNDAQAYASSAVDLLSLAFEVSERAKSEVELAATRDRHRAFIQASFDSIWSVDIAKGIDISLPPQQQIAQLREHARITDANDAFIRDYKLDTVDVVGRRFAEFMPELFKGSSLRDWIDRNYRLIDRELRHKVKGEDHHWLSLTLLGVVEDGCLVRIWGARRNITDRKRYQSLLEHLAFRDPLTGLLNRQRMVADINEMIEVAESQSADAVATLLLLDLNQFKDVNDTLGHGAGDEVLRQ